MHYAASMSAVAQVVVQVALDREFDYAIPEALAGRVAIGSCVTVPFGRQLLGGYVVGLSSASKFPNLKPIADVVGEQPYLDDVMLRLVRWIGDYYCAPVAHVIRSVLPAAIRRPGASFRTRLLVEVLADSAVASAPRDPAALSDKQRRVWDHLVAHGRTFLADLVAALEMSEAPVRALEKRGWITIGPAREGREPAGRLNILPTVPLVLNAEQREALDLLAGAMATADAAVGNRTQAAVVLLHGVTGSGKTEVYLQAIADRLSRGMGAIVLVPEIALTPQTTDRFVGRFGNQVAVLHSHLSEGERHDEWYRVLTGEARIVIGARSAVFAPVRRLGLIVVDEEHEHSYKQEESPRYNARDVAVMRGAMQGCAVLLGSATPSLESWTNVGRGKYILAALKQRVDDRRMPVVRLVDMRNEAEKRGGKASVFSTDLIEAIRSRLERAEQTILFLNRRGYSRALICPKCGHTEQCDHCSVACAYHRQDERLRCHLCGATRPVPSVCPGCADPAFKHAGLGTQRVEAVIRQCFPKARVARMDSDTTRGKGSHAAFLDDFRAGRIDILIGTQMIAKGLHFPNVTLVGVVFADLSLHLPDFRAGERTFQLLAQVAGRAGRGDVGGEVIVQTYTPFHPALQAARRTDFEGFSADELAFRKELGYPPYTHLIAVHFKGASEARVEASAQALGRELGSTLPKGAVLADPTPAPIARIKGQYRWQLLIRNASSGGVTTPLKAALLRLKMPADVTVAVDVDAVSLM